MGYAISNKIIYTPSASLTITNGGTTNIDGSNYGFKGLYTSSNATSTTFSYSNITDGTTVTIDYLKTTASDMAFTFPSGTVVSATSNAVLSGAGLIATITSSASGRYTIQIFNINSVYKVFITQDVA